MSWILLTIGLIIIPFYELALQCFPFVAVIANDTREPKLMLSLMIALGVALASIYQGNLKAFKNQGMLVFIAYTLVCIRFSPSIPLFVNENSASTFWEWKPVLFILIYSLFIFSVASFDWSQESFRKVLSVMSFVGVAMAGYVFIQKLGLDQFYYAKTAQQFTAVTSQSLVGNLGQPTVVGSFLAIILPITFASRKYFFAAIVAVALLLINSKFAILGGAVGSLAYLWMQGKRRCAEIIVLLLIFLVGSAYALHLISSVEFNDNGRFSQWSQILNFWRTPLDINGHKLKFCLTGFGPDSYQYLFPLAANSKFFHPHNEYILALFNFGLIGIGLIAWSMFIFLRGYFLESRSSMANAFMASFVSCLVCAVGTFIFGLGAHAFYIAVIFGLLNNQSFLRGGQNV